MVILLEDEWLEKTDNYRYVSSRLLLYFLKFRYDEFEMTLIVAYALCFVTEEDVKDN